jgi:hypothetical protein
MHLAGFFGCQVGKLPFTYFGLPLGTTKPGRGFRFRTPAPFGYTHVGLFVIRRIATILDRVNVMLILRLINGPREVPRLFGLTFTVKSPLQNLTNVENA